MGLEQKFHQAVGEWIEHCRTPHVQASSSSEPVRDCDAYREIISMGKKALPLLRSLYDADTSFYASGQDRRGEDAERDIPLSMIKGHGLVSTVREIIGDDFLIPEEIQGQISVVEEYTKNWLDENMHRYTSA